MHAVNRSFVRVEMEDELAKLTAGILHELNSPLGALRSATDTLSRMLDDEDSQMSARRRDSAQKLTAIVEQSVDRISQVVRGLERLTEIESASGELVDISAAISSALAMAKGFDQVEIEIAEAPMTIAASNRSVAGAVAAVINNAMQATSCGGTVRVSAHRDATDVVVCVEDSGRGMSAHELQNVFNIGFTEREGRVRLKTSLAWARRTMESMNGRIGISSAEGEGTRVEMRWPFVSPSL